MRRSHAENEHIDSVIREHYPDREACFRELPDLTWQQIRSRAQYIGVILMTSPRWAESEDEIVRREYPDYEGMGRLLPHRTRSALRGRALGLGITRHRRPWKAPAHAKIVALAQNMTIKQIYATVSIELPHMTAELIDSHLRYHRFKAITRQPLKAKVPVIEDLRQRCKSQASSFHRISTAAGCKDLLTKPGTAEVGSHKALVEATKLLGGELYVEWED